MELVLFVPIIEIARIPYNEGIISAETKCGDQVFLNTKQVLEQETNESITKVATNVVKENT